MSNMKKFWGYKGTDGKYHVSCFVCFSRVHDTYKSGEIVEATGPFPAMNQREAMKLVKQKIK